MDQGREQAPPFGDTNNTFGANHSEPESSGLGDDLNFAGMPDDADPGVFPGSPRARPWHSRAASALRNLRPGRRATHAAQTNDGPGSRTFLIYVIGGEFELVDEYAITLNFVLSQDTIPLITVSSLAPTLSTRLKHCGEFPIDVY
jgi:hypothetical protein